MLRPTRSSRLSTIALLGALAVSACNNHTTKQGTPAQLVSAGLAALQQGNDAAAISAFTDAAKKDPSNFYAHYNLGTIYQKQGNDQQALTEYGLALKTKPDYVPALFNSATIYGTTDPQLAMTTYRRITKLQPNAPTAYLNLGLIEARLGIFPQATTDLGTALKQDGTLSKSIPKDVLKSSPRPTPSK